MYAMRLVKVFKVALFRSADFTKHKVIDKKSYVSFQIIDQNKLVDFFIKLL